MLNHFNLEKFKFIAIQNQDHHLFSHDFLSSLTEPILILILTLLSVFLGSRGISKHENLSF
ncbi:hypothetical protein H1P_4240005 [Hyella patelloides LEGE 07179]|uniref:Uncharacterized protein n=1 Tax=Hyella patelloides LEGE 07179 TaxID=945734 RepID=A0A563VXS3_9CYAN|nr:hypothetical protein H1P_4240005 [Hyella patelloides LEGE 07179]